VASCCLPRLRSGRPSSVIVLASLAALGLAILPPASPRRRRHGSFGRGFQLEKENSRKRRLPVGKVSRRKKQKLPSRPNPSRKRHRRTPTYSRRVRTSLAAHGRREAAAFTVSLFKRGKSREGQANIILIISLPPSRVRPYFSAKFPCGENLSGTELLKWAMWRNWEDTLHRAPTAAGTRSMPASLTPGCGKFSWQRGLAPFAAQRPEGCSA
jgi:hypothetical protein